MDSEKKNFPSIYAISEAVHTVLTMCVPVMGISPNMLPKIRVRMLTILKRDKLTFRKIHVDRVVFYLMMRAVKELRVPCRREKILDALLAFHRHAHQSRAVEELGASVAEWRITTASTTETTESIESKNTSAAF